MNKVYDYIVIGSGISGLYCNYLLNNCKEKKYDGLLLEKDSIFGGRAEEVLFHNTMIKLGAGIMEATDSNILNLLKKLNIKTNKFISGIDSLLGYSFDMNNAIKKFKSMYKQHKNNNLTVNQFLIKYFDKEFIKKFLENCEYLDFLESDVEYFIKYYNIMDMMHTKREVYSIQWKELIDSMIMKNCINNYEVKKIDMYNDNYIINCFDSKQLQTKQYVTKKVIIATTLKPLDKLLGKIIEFKYNDYIDSIPFVRIYTYHKDKYDKSKLKHYNLVKNQLQKIILYNDNVLMASYSDNKKALYWRKILNLSKKEQIKLVEDKLKELDININKVDDVLIKYWDEGVHYFKPFGNKSFSSILKKLSNPKKNIYVIGELISKKQGNVEGSIESVNRIIDKILV